MVFRIEDTGIFILAVQGENVVLGNGTPMDVAWIIRIAPALDTGEQPFDAWAVTTDMISDGIDRSRSNILDCPVAGGVWFQFRNQVFGSGQDIV